jgi:hypothetical protein
MIMNAFVERKQNIGVLKAEYNILRNMVISLSKGDQSKACNQRPPSNSNWEEPNEDEIVHLLVDDMDIVKHDSTSLNANQEEVVNHHVFC